MYVVHTCRVYFQNVTRSDGAGVNVIFQLRPQELCGLPCSNFDEHNSPQQLHMQVCYTELYTRTGQYMREAVVDTSVHYCLRHS